MSLNTTKIPVRLGDYEGLYAPPTPVTVQIGYYEDGEFVVVECNHAGAEPQPTIGYSFWADAGVYVPDDDGPEVLVCDKCGAVYNDGVWEIN